MHTKAIALGACIALASTLPHPARAAPQDQLATCLVAHTDQADRLVLVKWIFAQFALNPSVAQMAQIPADKRDGIDKQMAVLLTRLITVDCPKDAQMAYLASGGAALEGAFNVLGQSAGRSLALDPDVQAGMTGFNKYLDKAKLDAVLSGASGPAPSASSHR